MKKVLFLLFFVGASSLVMAQQNDSVVMNPQLKYSVATNSFWSNWFLQANATYNVFYMDEDHGKHISNSLFESSRRAFGMSLAVGKWFTPGLGLRTKLSGCWGKQPSFKKDIKYWNAQEQVLFNLSNMICGYDENRVWNLIPYAGFGLLRDCSADRYAMGYSAGILNTFKLSRHVMLNLDINANEAESNFDAYTSVVDHPSFKGHDNIVSIEAGITYNLGRATWNHVPDVEALQALNQGQIDALNSQLADAQSENAELKDKLGKQSAQPETVKEKEMVANDVSVFFNLNSSSIASRKDLVDVKGIADYAKANDKSIVVTGYADSATGNAEINKALSMKRAKIVADEIAKMGISSDKIEVVAAGGSDELNPLNYNRRAIVHIK
jgi:OOP family OmpA-OmpF porin